MLSAARKAAPVRVLLVNSNRTETELLCSALRRHPGFSVTSCKANVVETLATVRASAPDVILTKAGIDNHAEIGESIHELKANSPSSAIIVVLDFYDREIVVSSLRAGARGLFCQTTQSFKLLCKCIHAVHDGQVWANAEQLTYAMDALAEGPHIKLTGASGQALLTARESQVVALVAEGLGNRSISKRLGVTENTIKKSLLHIFDKLGISNRVELVLYALSQDEKRQAEPEMGRVVREQSRELKVREGEFSVAITG